MCPSEAAYTCFLWPQAQTGHWFYSSSIKGSSLPFILLSVRCCTVRKELSLRVMLAVRVCESKGEGTTQLLAQPQHQGLLNMRWWRKIFFIELLSPCDEFTLNACFWCFLQVVGMDADQKPLSRGDSAGQGQSSRPGGPEGPQGRLGLTESLGRKLHGE